MISKKGFPRDESLGWGFRGKAPEMGPFFCYIVAAKLTIWRPMTVLFSAAKFFLFAA